MFLGVRIAHVSFGNVGHRNFDLMRRLKSAPQDDNGRWLRMASELCVGGFDLEETENKLGVLWVWDFVPETRQPMYTVL